MTQSLSATDRPTGPFDLELTRGTLRVESIDMLANDGGGVFVDRLTAERNGRTADPDPWT